MKLNLNVEMLKLSYISLLNLLSEEIMKKEILLASYEYVSYNGNLEPSSYDSNKIFQLKNEISDLKNERFQKYREAMTFLKRVR